MPAGRNPYVSGIYHGSECQPMQTAKLQCCSENFKANNYFLRDIKMAPSRDDDLVSSRQTTADKPTVYLLDTFPPKAIEHAKTLFDIIQPQDEEFQNWRQNA